MKIPLGFSPCPNDTFIFYALLHGKVDTGDLTFDPVIADVEILNQKALNRELPVTKLSFNAYLDLTEQYIILPCGSALGQNNGPLLVAAKPVKPEELQDLTVALPGEKTTAHFLFNFFSKRPQLKRMVPFHEIENLVLSGEVATGVLIHENRFTYTQRGLVLIQDLGSYWESHTGSAIPLGGIVADRNLPPALIQELGRMIRESIEYAWSHIEETLTFVKQYSQEMEEEVMMKHIQLYVNEFTLDLGEKGQRAIHYFVQEGKKQGRLTHLPVLPLFA